MAEKQRKTVRDYLLQGDPRGKYYSGKSSIYRDVYRINDIQSDGAQINARVIIESFTHGEEAHPLGRILFDKLATKIEIKRARDQTKKHDLLAKST